MKKHILFSLSIGMISTLFSQMTPTQVVQIPMRDGNSLAADVYVPQSCTSCPTILIQTPYNKNLFRNGLPLFTLQNLQASPYSWVVVDWRGFYGSAAAAVAQPERGQDGYDIINWIVAQPWNNGKVGTWGPSALGVIQYQTAKENHPNHTCAVPLVASPQISYQDYFYGGVLEKAKLEQMDALGYGLSGIVMGNVFYNNVWAFIEFNSFYPQSIRIPTLQIGGWYDHNIQSMMKWYTATRNQAEINVRERQWLLVGPWVHGGTGAAFVGSLNQGELSYPNAAFKNDSMALKFFEHYLLEQNNGWEFTPLITYYETGKNTWATTNANNLNSSTNYDLFLSNNGQLVLSGNIGITTFTSDPQNPTPTIGGHTLHPQLLQGPFDQSQLNNRNDVIIFSTPILDNDVQISGQVIANLFVSCTQPDADIVVRLVDEYPDGRSMLINDGIRRMRFRQGFTQTSVSLITPGEVFNIEVELPFVNYTWKKGHKIKIYISGNSSIRWDVNLQNGGLMYVAGQGNLADISIYHSTQYPSKLKMPGNLPLFSLHDTKVDYKIKIFPNPTQDFIQIRNEELDLPIRIEIFDLNGKKILSQASQSPNSAVDISSLRSGIYVMMVERNGEISLHKISKP